MEDTAIWIALVAVFIALIPAFTGRTAKARRERAEQAEARRRGDGGVSTSATAGDSRKAPDSEGESPCDSGGGGDGGGD